MKLTKDKLRSIIEEEIRSLSESVGTMDGSVRFIKQGSGGYILKIEDASGRSKSTRMTKAQADEFHKMVMDKL